MTFCPYTILSIPFFPMTFCPYTIFSIPFCLYHFVCYHFVLEPSIGYIICICILLTKCSFHKTHVRHKTRTLFYFPTGVDYRDFMQMLVSTLQVYLQAEHDPVSTDDKPLPPNSESKKCQTADPTHLQTHIQITS